MISRRTTIWIALATLAGLVGCARDANGDAGTIVDRIELPPGFTISLYHPDVPNARALVRGDQGTIFVGSRSLGSVHALRDLDGDQVADRRWTVATGLEMPTGLEFRDGALYVAEVSRIWRWPGIEDRLDDPPAPELVRDDFPTDRAHGWRYIRFGPDGLLYVPIGAPCNICDEDGYATITRLDVEGTGREVFARGVRNTVGFDFHPRTGELWFTDNGRDWMGDDLPPDELNHAPRAGLHFGYPHCHGRDVSDPEFGEGHDCADFTPPVQELGPHVAALGMRFYIGTMFPATYRGRIFIAEHGSWNRSEKIGYRVTMVTLDGDRATGYEPFATGWLEGETVHGRPVDLLVMPDGALLVSDDHAGCVYRIAYDGEDSP
ncbi:sorbosone dehydrogenase family protein [bacterium]|nr:sorbosone dehydrogenase family protein [bacterium]